MSVLLYAIGIIMCASGALLLAAALASQEPIIFLASLALMVGGYFLYSISVEAIIEIGGKMI